MAWLDAKSRANTSIIPYGWHETINSQWSNHVIFGQDFVRDTLADGFDLSKYQQEAFVVIGRKQSEEEGVWLT